MLARSAIANRQPEHRRGASLALFAGLLAAAAVTAQTQQNNTPAAQPQRPVTPAVQTPQVKRPPGAVNGVAPAAPANLSQALSNLANAARSPANTPAAGAPAAPANLNPALSNLPNGARAPANTPQGRVPQANRLNVASLNNQSPAARAVQSQMFLGHPGPAGSTVTRAPNGNIVRTASDGSVLDVRSPAKGMYIQHGLDGSRRITVEHPDRSRVFVTSRGVPYVQHPYMFRGRPMDHRTFVVQGKVFHAFYRPYNYGGTMLDVYAPTRFYDPTFYQGATTAFAKPVGYTWGYATQSAPWFSYYKGYFTPDPTYSTPQAWLADFVLGASLAVAYTTAPPTSQAPAGTSPAVTPEVKRALADEIDHQVKQESLEAQANAQNRDPPPGAGGVVQELADRQPHVFVVASDLDLVDPSGRRCSVSEGDVVQVVSTPNPGTGTADAVVMASKGGSECERSAQVQVAVSDLQEMQNHMRETIDMGLASSEPGKKAPTVPATFAASAPPPDPNAGHEIQQQQQLAALVDG